MTEPHRPASAARQSPRPMGARPMLMLALKYGAIFAIAVAVVAGLIGLAVSGVPGLLGGLEEGDGAAELDGWTILRIAPDLSPPAEQTNQ